MFELFSGDNDEDDWKPVLLIVELAVCASQSNAVLQSAYYIKTCATFF